jgi:hypothetical protein
MDKKAVALSGLSALLLASTSSGDAEAQQKLAAPPINAPKMTIAPPVVNNTARAIDTQRSKSINQASPAAVLKLNRIQADHTSGWIEHFTNGHTSTTNPIGNVQQTLKSR